jgi:hypothetical protein
MVGYLGERIELNAPWSTPLHLRTIAHALSLTNRFGGHTTVPYSVARHSIHVSRILERKHGNIGARVGLMHDAHEAYVGDVTSPIKVCLGDTWRLFEHKWETWVREAFDVVCPLEMREALKHADLVALATEKHQLVHTATPWDLELPKPDKTWDCIGAYGSHPVDVENAFLRRARSLGIVEEP